MIVRLAIGLVVVTLPLLGGPPSVGPDSSVVHVIDDFEAYTDGALPEAWKFITSSKEVWPLERIVSEREKFHVVEEDDNKFGRLYTRREALRVTMRNGEDFNWNLRDHPRIEWRWRAIHLPEGASEEGQNDVGAALYVTFGSDWLGRPKSIKYTYSSSLEVGTVVSFGPMKVIVVDSAREPRLGKWKTIQRSIPNDYKQVFGGDPPDRPTSITLWGDSDTTDDESEADFDDIALLPPFRR